LALEGGLATPKGQGVASANPDRWSGVAEATPYIFLSFFYLNLFLKSNKY
jgi:hypothetical protein